MIDNQQIVAAEEMLGRHRNKFFRHQNYDRHITFKIIIKYPKICFTEENEMIEHVQSQREAKLNPKRDRLKVRDDHRVS